MNQTEIESVLKQWLANRRKAAADPAGAARALAVWIGYLEEQGAIHNLTALKTAAEMLDRHALDSLAPFADGATPPGFDPGAVRRVLDVGSGNGFPGAALAALDPAWQVELLEATGKKCRFMADAAARAGLGGGRVAVVPGRAETLGQEKGRRATYDLVVARGLADLAVAAELCLPFVKVGGWWCAWKGPRVEEELPRAAWAIKLLGGGEAVRVGYVRSDAPDAGGGVAVWIRKERPSPAEYPRRDGVPSSKPLVRPGG